MHPYVSKDRKGRAVLRDLRELSEFRRPLAGPFLRASRRAKKMARREGRSECEERPDGGRLERTIADEIDRRHLRAVELLAEIAELTNELASQNESLRAILGADGGATNECEGILGAALA